MAEIKLIAMDLDGTLTQHKTPLSKEHRDILTALSKKYKLLMAGAGMCRRIFEQMERFPIAIIRPLCIVNENNVEAYAIESSFPAQIKNCPFENDSNRKAMKDLLAHLESLNPDARYNLWGSMSNIQPDLLPPRIIKKQ